MPPNGSQTYLASQDSFASTGPIKRFLKEDYYLPFMDWEQTQD